MEVGVGDDGAARDLVERDVLRRQVRCRGHRDAVAHARGVPQRPRQRLHAAEAAADHGGELRDAQAVEQPCLRVDPVLDGDDGKVGAVGPAGGRVGARRPRRAEARAGVVDADDEEAVAVERLAGPDEVVPPALALRLALVGAGNVVRRVERVAHEHGVGPVGVERAVGLVDQRVVRQPRPASQRQRLGEVHLLRRDVPDRPHERTTQKRNPAPLHTRSPGRWRLF